MSRPSPASPAFQLGVLAALGAVSLAVYHSALGDFFLADDFGLITAVAKGGPFALDSRIGGNWMFFRPVNSLAFWLDHRLWGLDPRGYHATNLALHVAACFLVFRVALRLGRLGLLPAAREPLVPVGAGLLFAVLHAHTESVIWISGRTDLLAAALGLAALDAHLGWRLHGGAVRRLASLALLALALGAKEAAASLPLMLAVVEWSRLERSLGVAARLRRVGRTLGPVVALGVVYAVWRSLVVGNLVGGYGAAEHLRLSPGLVFDTLRHALERMLVPVREVPWSGAARWVFGAGSLAALLALAWRARRRGLVALRGAAAASAALLLALFVAALLPVINLDLRTADSQGERVLYLATAVGAIALAAGIGALPRPSWRLAALAALTLYHAAGTLVLARNWETASTIAREAVERVLAEDPGEPLYVLGAPASYRGAHLFPGGLYEPAYLLGGLRPRAPIYLLAHTTLRSPDDTTEWTRSPTDPSTLLFRHSNGLLFPLVLPEARDFELGRLMLGGQMRVTFAPGRREVRVAAFERGRLEIHRVELGAAPDRVD